MADGRRIGIHFDVNSEELQKLEKSIKIMDGFNRQVEKLGKATGSVSGAFDKMSQAQQRTAHKQQNLNKMMKQFDGALKKQSFSINNIQMAQAGLSKRLEKMGRDVSLTMKETGEFTASLKNLQNQTVKISGTFDEATGKITKMNKSVKMTAQTLEEKRKKAKEARLELERMKGTKITNRVSDFDSWDVKTDSLIRFGKVIQGSMDKNNKFTQTIVTQSGEVKKITGYYSRANRELVQYNEQVSKASKQQLYQAGFDNSAVHRIGAMSDSMKGLNKYTMSWNEAMEISALRMVQWSIAGTAIFGTQRALREMINTIIEVDTQVTEMKKVMNEDTNFDRLLQRSIELSTTLGRRITDVNEAFIEFGRQGLNEKQVELMAKATTLMANVGDIDAGTSASKLTGIITVFDKQFTEATDVVDRFNEVQNNYATTVDILTSSVQRAGGTASSFGIELEDLIGHTTAIGEATRESGRIVGNSLKTIYSRITTVQPAIDMLGDVGVNVFDPMTGSVRKVNDILGDLAGRWDILSEAEKQNIGVKVAGRYQLTRFLALMDNYDTAIRATATAENSWGSSMKENQTYMESLQAKINIFYASLQELALALGEAGVAKGFELALEGATKLIKGVTTVVETFKGFSLAIPTVLGLLGATQFQFSRLSKSTEMLKAGIVNVNPTLTNLGTRMGMSTSSSVALAGAIGKVTTSIKNMALATVTNPLFWIPLAITGISTLVGHFKQLEERQNELATTTSTAREEYELFIDQINRGTVDDFQVNKYKKQIRELKSAQEDLNEIVATGSTKMTNNDLAMSRAGRSVAVLSEKKEILNSQYENEKTAMSQLSDKHEDLLAQMGISIDADTTIKEVKEQVIQKQDEYSKSVERAENALKKAKEEAILPTAKAYYDMAEALDENSSAMENAMGISNSYVDSLKEAWGLYKTLIEVKNRNTVQDKLLTSAEETLTSQFGITSDELKKRPGIVDENLKKYDEMMELSKKVADNTASDEERKRLAQLMTTENVEKYEKRQEQAVTRAYDNKMTKIFEFENKLAGSTSTNKDNLDSESNKAKDNANAHEASSKKSQKSASDKAVATEQARRKNNSNLQQEIDKLKTTGERWLVMSDEASDANSQVESTTKTSKDNTTSYLGTLIGAIKDAEIGWGDLASAFASPITGVAKLSIKAMFGGLFGSGGSIDGDKLKEAVVSSGGGSISGSGYGGLTYTSGFGARKHPITGQMKFHAGMDLAGPVGYPIRARQGGYVTQAGWAGGYGNMVTIQGTNGLEYRYAHNNSLNVSPGQFVPAGATIAGLGSTGDSTGPHLHFEVRRNGQALNPVGYYHSGGIVSDKPRHNEVDARLQVGEMVINQNQQRQLFDFLNKKNGNDTYTGMGGPAQQYRVERGDTLSEIAQRFGTTVSKLMKLNPGIKNPDRIYAGNTIKVKKSTSGGTSTGNYFDNKKDAEAYVQRGYDIVNHAERTGIRGDDYRVRNLTSGHYREAFAKSGKKYDYNEMVYEGLSKFTNYKEAKELFEKADVFLKSSDKAKMLNSVLEEIGQNALAEINEKTNIWLDNFNSKVKEAHGSIKAMLDVSNQIDRRKIDEARENFVSGRSSDILSGLGVADQVDPLDAKKNKANELKQLMESRAEESALIEYRLKSGLLEPRMKELQGYRDQIQAQMQAVRDDFASRGITDSSLINEALDPLKGRLAEITSEYNELKDAMANGKQTLADNKSELEGLAEEYKKLQEEIKQAESRREYTDVWGNVVRDAEGGVKMVSEQGQNIIDTYEQIREKMEEVKGVATKGKGTPSVITPLIDQLKEQFENAKGKDLPSVIAPLVNHLRGLSNKKFEDILLPITPQANIDPGSATVNNTNSTTNETQTYQANTNVNRNVTYVVQTGVALASESELKEFAMHIKDMIDEEEGRSKS